MFIALSVALSIIKALRPVLARIRTKDATLARQITDAASSTALNLGEGSRRVGKDQQHFYRIAAGSCEEVRTGIAVAKAWGWLDGHDLSELDSLLDREGALVYRLEHPRAA